VTAKREREITQFLAWLPARGAEVLKPTSEWELVRFRSGQGVSIIYTNATGKRTFTGEALAAFNAFKSSQHWRGAVATKRRQSSSVLVRTIRERDGDLCFFCQRFMPIGEESVEHLVPATAGGPNHITNLFLAHQNCNAKAGHLSAPEKINRHVTAVIESHA